MKIKKTRQVRLDELIKYVWDNNIKDCTFKSNHDKCLYVNTKGNLDFGYQVLIINPDELFTITEEVELTDDTVLEYVIAFGEFNTRAFHYRNIMLRRLKKDFEKIYLLNEDETQYNLIWTKEV